MIRHQIPVTRQNYLEMAYPDGIPEINSGAGATASGVPATKNECSVAAKPEHQKDHCKGRVKLTEEAAITCRASSNSAYYVEQDPTNDNEYNEWLTNVAKVQELLWHKRQRKRWTHD